MPEFGDRCKKGWNNLQYMSVSISSIISQTDICWPWLPRRWISIRTKVVSYKWIDTNILLLFKISKSWTAYISPEARYRSILVA